MNDAAQEENSDADNAKSKSALPRQLILLACLGVMLGALYFDRKIARPESEGKSEELLAAAQKRLNSDQPQLSPTEVEDVLGRPAADIEDAENYVLESYKWSAGLPWRSYDVHVLYTKTEETPRYYASYYNIRPENDALPGYIAPKGEEVEPPTRNNDNGPPGGAGPGLEGNFEPVPGVPTSDLLLENPDTPIPSDPDPTTEPSKPAAPEESEPADGQ